MALTFSITPNASESGVKVLYARPAPALAVMSRDHPLSRRRRLDIRDLSGYPIALTDELSSTYKLYQLASNMTGRSEEHTSELQSLMRISYAVFCLKKKK